MLNHPLKHSMRAATVAKAFVLAGLAVGIGGTACAQQAGTVTHLSGTLAVKRPDAPPRTLAVKSEVKEGDVLVTQDETYARIKFSDNSEVVLRPNTELKIESYAFNQAKPESDSSVLSIVKGGLRFVTGLVGKRNRDKVSFSTATATIGIRGTGGGILHCQNDCGGVRTGSGGTPQNGTYVDVSSGSVWVSTGAGKLPVNTGQFAFAGNPNELPKIIPSSQGVQVTMPPAIAKNNGGGQGIGKGKDGECAL